MSEMTPVGLCPFTRKDALTTDTIEPWTAAELLPVTINLQDFYCIIPWLTVWLATFFLSIRLSTHVFYSHLNHRPKAQGFQHYRTAKGQNIWFEGWALQLRPSRKNSWTFMKVHEIWKMYQYFMVFHEDFHELSWKFMNLHENDSC